MIRKGRYSKYIFFSNSVCLVADVARRLIAFDADAGASVALCSEDLGLISPWRILNERC